MTERDYSLTGTESASAVRNGLANARWYQSPVPEADMEELLRRRNAPAVRDTLIWFALLFLSGFAVYWFWGSWIAIFPYIVYSVIYGSSSDSRWHESSHGTAFKTDWMNNVLYEISSFMVFRQSTAWKWSHARHHSDTIIRGRDPEISVKTPPDWTGLLLTFVGYSAVIPEARKLFRHVVGKIDSQVATYVPVSEQKKIFATARIYLAIYLAVIAASVYFHSWLPVLYIGLPNFLGAWLMPVYGFTQHAGLQENVLDHRLNSRTVYMNRLNRFLYWNMNYHVEHHMFPMVPYYNLPKLHQLILRDCPKPYPGIVAAFREIFETLKIQQTNPDYFATRKIPRTARPSANPQIIQGDATRYSAGWLEAGFVEEFPLGRARRLDFAGKTYAIYRTGTDEFYATDGNCSHGNAHLSDGLIVDNMIECSKHNGRFCLADGSPCRKPVTVAIETYNVQIRAEKIWLEIPSYK